MLQGKISNKLKNLTILGKSLVGFCSEIAQKTCEKSACALNNTILENLTIFVSINKFSL